jgi:hypothetical protein
MSLRDYSTDHVMDVARRWQTANAGRVPTEAEINAIIRDAIVTMPPMCASYRSMLESGKWHDGVTEETVRTRNEQALAVLDGGAVMPSAPATAAAAGLG